MIELYASDPFYIDDPGAPCLAVGFSDRRDSTRFVGFERAYRVDPDDGRYLEESVSVDFGLDEPLRGIYPDVVESLRLERERLTLVLRGDLHGTIVIHFAAVGAEYDRLESTLAVMFDGTGRLVMIPDGGA